MGKLRKDRRDLATTPPPPVARPTPELVEMIGHELTTDIPTRHFPENEHDVAIGLYIVREILSALRFPATYTTPVDSVGRMPFRLEFDHGRVLLQWNGTGGAAGRQYVSTVIGAAATVVSRYAGVRVERLSAPNHTPIYQFSM